MTERRPQRQIEHLKVRATLERLRAADPRGRCAEPPGDEMLKAIHEFNAGEFFEQHETFELIWRAESDDIRYLYQGILQVGIGFYHLQSGNYHGAITKLRTGTAMLEYFQPTCRGVDVARLVAEARAAREHLLELGEERMGEFNRTLIPRLHLVQDAPPA
jgi:predicted metal-dependent hydrolase